MFLKSVCVKWKEHIYEHQNIYLLLHVTIYNNMDKM